MIREKRIQKFQLFNKINFVFRKEANLKSSPLLHISIQGGFFMSLTILIKQFKNRHFLKTRKYNKKLNLLCIDKEVEIKLRPAWCLVNLIVKFLPTFFCMLVLVK